MRVSLTQGASVPALLCWDFFPGNISEDPELNWPHYSIFCILNKKVRVSTSCALAMQGTMAVEIDVMHCKSTRPSCSPPLPLCAGALVLIRTSSAQLLNREGGDVEPEVVRDSL